MRGKRLLLGSAAALALMSTETAFAQDAEGAQPAAEASPAEGEEGRDSSPDIIVTARGREELVIDVPYNFSAVSGEEIEARGIIDAPELLRSIPGVSVVDRGYRNSGVWNGVFIRGINTDGSAQGDYWVSGVSTVSTYIDRTPLFANFVLSDIERVEVLRGPQGTLYGSGSLGGTVRYILREPRLEEFSGRVGATLSQVDESGAWGKGFSGTLNIPLGSVAALRLNGQLLDYPGLTDYANVYVLDAEGLPIAPNGLLDPGTEYERVKDADTADIWYARASLLVEPSDTFRFLLSYMRQEDDIGGRRQWTRGTDGYGREYERGENGSVLLEPSEREVDLTSLEATLDLGFATLTSSTSYYDHAGSSTSEATGVYAQLPGNDFCESIGLGYLACFYYGFPRPMVPAERTYRDRSWVQEVRLVSDGEGRFDYVLGGYYQDQNIDVTEEVFLRGFKRWFDVWWEPQFRDFFVVSDSRFRYNQNEKFTDLAFYGELTFRPFENFQITGGMRWFRNKSERVTAMNVGVWTSFNPEVAEDLTVRNSRVLFKGNFSWDVSDRAKIYGTVSEGYRRGGSNAIPDYVDDPVLGEDPAWQTYGPDSVINYELGVKGDLGPVRYNAAVFHIDWDNIQLNTTTPNVFYAVQNGGGAKSTGLELELSGRLGPLNFTAGYTYVDAKLTENMYEPHNPNGVPIALEGARLTGTPEHSANAAVEYSTTIGNDLRWSLRGSGYYQSSTENSIGYTALFARTFRPFTIWNASTTFGKGPVDVTFFIKNIFNSLGVTGHYSETFMGTDPGEGYYGNGSKELISLPRTIGASINFNF